VRSIALDDLDQVRHEIVALLELNVDVAEGLTAGQGRPNTGHDDDYPADGGHFDLVELPLQAPFPRDAHVIFTIA
jgi:hypothetical protein